ncbi:MAG TPA: SH3 domain-containing protein [Rectinemataceae bacterium]|nr:SH3 domain-containing protein [Rectinemataceae bacterium]
MRTTFSKSLAIATALATLLLASSCAPRLGWGLLLWTDQEAGLHAGAVVPVYIRSNIEKTYVIGVPGTKRKVEVPLWQLDLYRSRGAAEKARIPFGNYLTSYLFANRDGLPVRDAPSNAGQRVYRLREGQSVKILAEAKGDAVQTGDQVLAGSWYKVLTEDGTRGFVFSNTMRLYDELTEAPPSIAQSNADATARNVDLVFSQTWRGEYFQTMIDDGRIDLDTFNARYGLFADAVQRQIRIELPWTSQVFNYSSIAQSGQDFIFEGTPLKISLDGDKRLIADWSGSSSGSSGSTAAQDAANAMMSATPASASSGAPAPGVRQASGSNSAAFPATAAASPTAPGPANPAPAQSRPLSSPPQPPNSPQGGAPATGQIAGQAAAGQSTPPDALSTAPGSVDGGMISSTQAVFVVLNQDIRDVVRAEEFRRINLLGQFADRGTTWNFHPEANTMSAGATPAASRLYISRAGRFNWTSVESIPAEYLGTDLGDVVDGAVSGEATVRLDLDPSLAGRWEGALSLRFDGTRGWLDFLYRHEGANLILEPLASGGVRNMTATTAATLAPLVFDLSK